MTIPLPTITDLIDVAAAGTRAFSDKSADFTRGSDYESLVGPCAMIWSREAYRDDDMFNAVNFHTADGQDLTDMVLARYGVARILDTRGTGQVILSRPSGGTPETIWKGTRILLTGGIAKSYRTTADVAVGSSALSAILPIESITMGPGSQANVAGGKIGDTLVDPTWIVQSLRCTDGTTFEKAGDFRSRVRAERVEARVGQVKSITDACMAAGAAQVQLFRSDYAGEAYDAGLNVCYVGNRGYEGTTELVKACTLALRGFRVAGDHLQVLPMAKVEVTVEALVYLNGAPSLYDTARIERIQHASINQYMNGTSGKFTFSVDGIVAALARHTPETQRVTVITPTTNAVITSGTSKRFPDVLNRYVLTAVSLRYTGP